MEEVTLAKLSTGSVSNFNDIRDVILSDLWPKICDEAVQCLHDRLADPEARQHACKSVEILRQRSQGNAKLSNNPDLARQLQEQVAGNQNALVAKAINRVYPRDKFHWRPWPEDHDRRGNMIPRKLNALVSLFVALVPLVRAVKSSAKDSLFESIPYICYVVVIVALFESSDALTVEWWRSKDNHFKLQRWAHYAAKKTEVCDKIWSGIDLLVEAQNITYAFNDGSMVSARESALMNTRNIADFVVRNAENPRMVVYGDSDVMELIDLVKDIDLAKAEDLHSRHKLVKEKIESHGSDHNTNFLAYEALAEVWKQAAQVWTTIVAVVDRDLTNSRVLDAVRRQGEARRVRARDSHLNSEQIAIHVAEGLRFSLLLHNKAAFIREKVSTREGVALFLKRVDSQGKLKDPRGADMYVDDPCD